MGSGGLRRWAPLCTATAGIDGTAFWAVQVSQPDLWQEWYVRNRNGIWWINITILLGMSSNSSFSSCLEYSWRISAENNAYFYFLPFRQSSSLPPHVDFPSSSVYLPRLLQLWAFLTPLFPWNITLTLSDHTWAPATSSMSISKSILVQLTARDELTSLRCSVCSTPPTKVERSDVEGVWELRAASEFCKNFNICQ